MDTPIIKCEPRKDFEGGMEFYCPFCRDYHRHGRGEGHRGAHCTSEQSPFKATGYIITLDPITYLKQHPEDKIKNARGR